jgi:nucleoside-diphosphate-sugar epimerase
MRAIVIGGAGFIGAYVVRALRRRGWQVTVLGRGDPLEVAEPPLPDLVVHMGAMNEADARAAADAFEGKAGRLVAASSGDVYLAYARFTGLEPGPPVPVPLTEEAPLRTRLFPYRNAAPSPADKLFHYDKILVERELLGRAGLDSAIARLPKVYGPERNSDFATVHAYADQPHWRWTHAYVENVAEALVLIGTAPQLPRRIYNIGEERTPTVAERLQDLPPSPIEPSQAKPLDFRQDVVMDSSAIRCDLGYAERVGYAEGLGLTLAGRHAAPA